MAAAPLIVGPCPGSEELEAEEIVARAGEGVVEFMLFLDVLLADVPQNGMISNIVPVVKISRLPRR